MHKARPAGSAEYHADGQTTYKAIKATCEGAKALIYAIIAGGQTEQSDAGLLRVLTVELLQKSAGVMADVYHFNEAQRAQLAELLDPEQAELWESLLSMQGFVLENFSA